MPPSAELEHVLASTQHLLLDFDGPICAMFAGLPARAVVVELLEVVQTDLDLERIPDGIAETSDPFDILRYAATVDPALARRVEKALRRAEITASRSARPTAHTPELLRSWRTTGRRAAVVSNNSAAAVERYLNAQGLEVDAVVGRCSADPSHLKPSPYMLIQALEALDSRPAQATFVGDSVDDVVAGAQAGVRSVGYANKPGKHEALSDAGADVVIDDMAILATAVADELS